MGIPCEDKARKAILRQVRGATTSLWAWIQGDWAGLEVLWQERSWSPKHGGRPGVGLGNVPWLGPCECTQSSQSLQQALSCHVRWKRGLPLLLSLCLLLGWREGQGGRNIPPLWAQQQPRPEQAVAQEPAGDDFRQCGKTPPRGPEQGRRPLARTFYYSCAEEEHTEECGLVLPPWGGHVWANMGFAC